MISPWKRRYYDRKNAKRRKDYADCKAKGICCRCKTAPALEGELWCSECKVIIKDTERRYRENLTPRGRQNKRDNLNMWRWKRRIVLEVLGLCTRCEVNPVSKGYKMCDDCRAFMRESNKKWNPLRKARKAKKLAEQKRQQEQQEKENQQHDTDNT